MCNRNVCTSWQKEKSTFQRVASLLWSHFSARTVRSIGAGNEHSTDPGASGVAVWRGLGFGLDDTSASASIDINLNRDWIFLLVIFLAFSLSSIQLHLRLLTLHHCLACMYVGGCYVRIKYSCTHWFVLYTHTYELLLAELYWIGDMLYKYIDY